LQAEVLPQLGPGVLAYMEAPAAEEDSPTAQPTKVAIISLGNATGVTDAVENALRTLLAFHALDPRHGQGQLQVESREVEGRKVTALSPTSPFTFAIDRDRLILGSSAAAVVRSLSRSTIATESPVERLRAGRFPGAESFAYVDFVQLHRYILDHRGPIVERQAARQHRRVGEVERDLDQTAALMALFQQGYITSAIEPDATAVHRSIGLIARKPAPAAPE
jgi:hypothetical protein